MSILQLQRVIYYSTVLVLLSIQSVFPQADFGVINDADGYTNVRSMPNSNSEIKVKIFDNEFFQILDKSTDWWLIKTTEDVEGYMHKSRVRTIQKYERNNRKYDLNDFDISFSTRSLKSIDVRISQIKSKGLYPNDEDWFVVRAWVEVFKNNEKINEVYFDNMDLEGAGVYHTHFTLDDKIFLQKRGDYAGVIMTIDKDGQVFQFFGGSFLVTKNKRYLISPWDSDLSGVTVIDLEDNKAIIKESTEYYLNDWYFLDNRYYTKGKHVDNNKDKVFYLDLQNGKLLSSDLKSLEIYNENKLKYWYEEDK